MKAQVSKRVITYSLVTAMLLTQSASAFAIRDLLPSKEVVISVPAAHPCAAELNQELAQIQIMEEAQNVINRDSTLRVSVGSGVSAMDGQNAVSAALAGDWFTAAIETVSAAINVSRTVQEGKKDIKTHFTLASGIAERKTNLKYVLANPNVCNDNVRKAYLAQFIADTQTRNKNFLTVLDAAIAKTEGSITPIQNAVALVAGVAAAIGMVAVIKAKGPGLYYVVLGAGAFLGIGTGVIGYGKDYIHNIPTLNDLKAQKSATERISSQLQEQLNQLR